MNLSELRTKIREKAVKSVSTTVPARVTRGDGVPLGPIANELTDPYWGTRQRVVPENVNPTSPFRQSLAFHAERAGRRITPPQTQTMAPEGPKSTGRLRDYFDAIEEAATRQCAYCGGDEPWKGSCHFCSAPKEQKPIIVHTAGEQLVLPERHSIFVVDDVGVVRQHYLERKEDGQTILTLDGKEIPINEPK